MNYYNFSEQYTSRYVSAIDICNYSDMPFNSCDMCGADELVKWGEATPVFECETVTQSRTLPDLMLYGGRNIGSFDTWSIVSEKVKTLFKAEQFTGASFYPADLVYTKRNKQIKLEEKYYIMTAVGRAEIDFAAMGVSCSICPKCGHYIFEGEFPLGVRTQKGIYPTILKKNTWDGSDLFGHNDCTERFVLKILEGKLTGFEFLPFEQTYDAFENKKYFRTLNGLSKIKTQR